MASGILLVRTLDQRQYAYFTIAFAMMSTMNILADSGIGAGLSSIGGRVWQDPDRLGQLINTAMRLRRYLGTISIVAVTPLLIWMLIRNGASKPYAGIITLAVLFSLSCELASGVLSVVPRLHSQIGRVQKLDLIGALCRLVVLCAAYFLFLNAAVAVCATLFSVFIQYLLLRRWVGDSINTTAPVNSEDRSEILKIVRSQAPNAVFYCVQGQIAIWLIGIFGSTKNVAEIGALGRLGIMFAVISSIMTSIVLPGFARCQSPTQLRRRYFQILGAFGVFGLSLIVLARLFPSELLWILGSKYSHLRGQLLLMMTLTAFSSLIAAMWSLNSTKAWIKFSWFNIPATVATQVVLLTLLDISTLDGVLWFGILSLVPTLLLNIGLSYRGLIGKTGSPQTA
ncbi:MAG: hypothetical protein QOG23_3528 [Blastocatellia bacterium]|nr:hypothetical protein [Blastocatellia bacterium]